MSIVPGIYQAKGIQIGFKPITNQQYPVCQVECYLGRHWKDGKWEATCAPKSEPPKFVCEKFLFKSNGEVSDFNVKVFQEVFGWDCESFATLEAIDISKTYFNVTIALNDDGYLEAQFINPRNDAPSMGKPKEVKKMGSAALSKFRIKPAESDLSYSGEVPISESDVPF